MLPSEPTTITRGSGPAAMDAGRLRLLTADPVASRPHASRSRASGLVRPAAVLSLASGAALVPARPALGLALLAGGGFLWAALHDPLAQTLHRVRTPRPERWYVGARHDLDVVGVAAHQRELVRVRDRHGATGLIATLVPERDRRSGEQRVRVDLHGYAVGRLSDAAAATYRERMGATPSAVPVSLVGHDPIEVEI